MAPKRAAGGGPGSWLYKRRRENEDEDKKKHRRLTRMLQSEIAYRARTRAMEERAMFLAYGPLRRERAPASSGGGLANLSQRRTEHMSNRGQFMHRRQQLWQNRTAAYALGQHRVWADRPNTTRADGSHTVLGTTRNIPPEVIRHIGQYTVSAEPIEMPGSRLNNRPWQQIAGSLSAGEIEHVRAAGSGYISYGFQFGTGHLLPDEQDPGSGGELR